MAAVRFGADKIFRAGDEELTDADIDTMLASAKDMTAERKGLENKEKKNLLDFSDANVNFQEFEGIDYKGSGQQGDMSFMEIMQVTLGARVSPHPHPNPNANPNPNPSPNANP